MSSSDLVTRADLERLLRDFYTRAFADDLLRHVFVDVVQMDLEEHLPAIVGFWEKVLFDTGSYSGRTMEVHREVHRRVPLTEAHFTRWLALWRESLDAGFSGPVAEQAAADAGRMARVFVRNLSGQEQLSRSLPLVPVPSVPVRAPAPPAAREPRTSG